MITYNLLGIDDEGNIKVDVKLSRELAGKVLLDVVEEGVMVREISPLAPLPVLHKMVGKEVEGFDVIVRETPSPSKSKTSQGPEPKKVEKQNGGRKSKIPEAVAQKLISLFAKGRTIREAAAEVGISYSTAHRLLNAAGVDTAQGSKKTAEKTNAASAVTDEEILALHRDDYSNHAIEAKLGVHRGRIATVLLKHGITSEHQKRLADARCIKCSKRGHLPAQCPTGDALDRLDRAQGPRPRTNSMSEHHFTQCRLSAQHEIPQEVIARELNLATREVEKAILAYDYASYSA